MSKEYTPSSLAADYLVAMYNLAVEGDAVTGVRLAQKFHVSPVSVTEMLGRLRRHGYVRVDDVRGTILTGTGVKEAEVSLHRHRLAERFLYEALGFDWVGAHLEALTLQHALTPTIQARIVAVLRNPTTCPHGNPIPGDSSNTLEFLRSHQALRLSAVAVDAAVSVLCISELVEDETSLLRYLDENGLRPGALVTVRDAGPAGAGPLILDVANRPVALDRDVAKGIWVCPQRQPGSIDGRDCPVYANTQTGVPANGKTVRP
jgi:DtxR family transcriptional regulator, Mn-dependent transcriptional regulator